VNLMMQYGLSDLSSYQHEVHCSGRLEHTAGGVPTHSSLQRTPREHKHVDRDLFLNAEPHVPGREHSHCAFITISDVNLLLSWGAMRAVRFALAG
jgi:hypothetical protein